MSRYQRVTAADPCPACGHADWCAWDGELLRCQRPAASSTPAGMSLRQSELEYCLYGPEEARGGHSPTGKKPPGPPPANLAALALRFRKQIKQAGLDVLAQDLGVPA